METYTEYAEVAVNAAVHGTFHYHIPEKYEGLLVCGHLVRVAFGTAMQTGIVLAIHDELPPDLQDIQTKPIIELLDRQPMMTPQHIALALWMSQTYLTAIGACLWLMLPPGLTGSSMRMVHLLDDKAEGSTDGRQEILDFLHEESPRKLSQIKRLSSYKTAAAMVRDLEKQGIVRTESVLAPAKASRKVIKTVIRAIPEDKIVDALSRLKNAPKQSQIFAYIARFDYPLDIPEIRDKIDATKAQLDALERKGLVQYGERIVFRDSLADKDFVPNQPLQLVGEQQQVWEVVREALQNPTPALPKFEEGAKSAPTQHIGETAQDSPPNLGEKSQQQRGFLLHGVTGSGKTEIYLHAIAETLRQGRQAIFLVPEIALTPQTIRRVAERFPEQVAIVHGSLSQGERYDTWRRARDGDIGVIVGTRSALFTPLPDIGLIILDEEHDTSYKQAPPIAPPYYHARAVAEKISTLNHATLILGSATPDIETFYRAQKGDLTYLHLPNRIMGHKQRIQKQAKQRHVELRYASVEGDAMTIGLPPVSVVDMREELKSGNTSMFSRDLQTSLEGVLQRGEQAMLFLNRRGQSTYVFCRDCGYVVMCDNCDMPMTYHRHGEAMRCHHCNHQQAVPTACPDCGSRRIRYFGAGTQQVEAELKKQFPTAKTVRWDADTAHKPDLHESILAKFISGEANVMVGTQMIAKGLDIPLVTLVGVISADPGLALPDFRANERAFQLLTQVAGRAGRGILGGEVILQTYQPKHASIVAAAHHDYERFYNAEIDARRDMGYPPFRKLGRVLVHNQHPIEAQRQIEDAAAKLRHIISENQLTDTHLIGPTPCFFSRIDKHYRWHILVRSADPLAALSHLQTRSGWYIDINPVDVL
ncbi:MAG: primosomal protein N' [Anaerolineae bacterium]|nr:primosomal protein N' [Anaerolineae bacterium]